MNYHHAPIHVSNPFSTRYVRPGAIPFVFSRDGEADRLIDRLAIHGWRGAILGPHGSGKSTLLATLLPFFTARAIDCRPISLHDGQRTLPGQWLGSSTTDAQTAERRMPERLLIIDGFEQLNRWNRWRVAQTCRRRHWGLLVTAHSEIGLPIVHITRPEIDLFGQITAQLQACDVRLITPGDAADAFRKADGNVREALFDLYDRYEQRRFSELRRCVTRTNGISGLSLPVV